MFSRCTGLPTLLHEDLLFSLLTSTLYCAIFRSSSYNSLSLALYVAETEQRCELLKSQAKLEFFEKEIRDSCDDLESHYLRLDALVELVATKNLYCLRYSSDRAWIRSLDLNTRDAIDYSQAHGGMCTDSMMKINRSWNV